MKTVKKQTGMKKHLIYIIASSLWLFAFSANAQTQSGPVITRSVYGGGNRASVTGDVSIGISAGEVNGYEGKGVFGGCNEVGSIAGDVVINITGGLIGIDDENTANIHGGGFGKLTTVTGNVDIQFGEVAYDNSGENPVEIHNEFPKLYGDLYGGSALGNVNTATHTDPTVETTTTIHIDNGTLLGDVYGGGLGYKDVNNPQNDVEAMAYGMVYVNVGRTDGEETPTYSGMASFVDCSIFGCNNLNGSPQDSVFVDIYKTNHTEKDKAEYIGEDREYAIYRVFGGGNMADYAPEGGLIDSKKYTHVRIHGCLNTVEEVFGGSNAADAVSTYTIVDGGRFSLIFGGGNGTESEANVGVSDLFDQITYSRVNGGRVGYYFGGSNMLGNCVNINQGTEEGGGCGDLTIDYLFNGGNQADQYGDQILNLTCADEKSYLSAYGGCRLGSIYGNITITITGGTIGTLFGGCQGSNTFAANVKRYPTLEELNSGTYAQGLVEYLENQYNLGNFLYGTGGNITVNVYGGAVGTVYGGCDRNGNVDGKITVNVANEENTCGFFVGNVYGASNRTNYVPENQDGISPVVNIIKGTIGGEHEFNGISGIQEDEKYAGNVFGASHLGYIVSNPKVVVGEPTNTNEVTILGNVYGGGDEGNVNGNARVIIVPKSYELNIETPENGTITVTDMQGDPVSNGSSVVDGTLLRIVATPNAGFALDEWSVTGDGSCVDNPTLATTIFTMGNENATLTASFVEGHTLTFVANPEGTSAFLVNDVLCSGPVSIPENTTVNVMAWPNTGYAFTNWTNVEGLNDPNSASTTFTMGASDVTLTAQFQRVHSLTLVSDPEGACTFKVNGVDYTGPVWLAEDATVEVQAVSEGTFTGWTIDAAGAAAGASVSSASATTTTFTMGTANTTLTAQYGRGRRTNNNRNSD